MVTPLHEPLRIIGSVNTVKPQRNFITMRKKSFAQTIIKLSALSIFVCGSLFADQLSNRSYAGAGSTVVTELTEFLCRKVGGTVTKEAAEKMAVSVEKKMFAMVTTESVRFVRQALLQSVRLNRRVTLPLLA